MLTEMVKNKNKVTVELQTIWDARKIYSVKSSLKSDPVGVTLYIVTRPQSQTIECNLSIYWGQLI